MLTLLLASQKKALVEPYLQKTVSLLFSQIGNTSHEYFFAAWERLCSVYDNFADLNIIFPILFNHSKTMDDFYSDEEICSGPKALGMTFVSFKENAAQFV